MARSPTLTSVVTAYVVRNASGNSSCDTSTFPVSHDGVVFMGLHQATNATNADECQQACCDEINLGLSCAVWQWAAQEPALPVGTCWIGPAGLPSKPQEGWVSRGAEHPPSPAPSTITCAADHTPCAAAYSRSGEGCCTFADGVCCPNRQTCCPAGTTCQQSGPYLTDCVNVTSRIAGKSVCKPGPQQAFSTAKKNIVVLGDSVSIGYTPVLNQALQDIALVQHSPYDSSDGGAEETAYGLQCLDYFIHGPGGNLLVPDVLVFNFGLHDGPLGNTTIPGQQGNSSVYAEELEQIVLKLKATYDGLKTQLVFALTSPMLCDANADGNVVALNNIATGLMQQHAALFVDPHTAIVDECGPAPQASCFGNTGCFCPHCAGQGYSWLAQNVFEPFLRKILDSDSKALV